MMSERLTETGAAAILAAMQGRTAARRRRLRAIVVAGAAAALAGCVSVKAPDQPIVIELNVNIKQEVVYRLAEDAGKTVKENPGIF